MVVLVVGYMAFNHAQYKQCEVIPGNDFVTVKLEMNSVDSIRAIFIDYNASGYGVGTLEESPSFNEDISKVKQLWKTEGRLLVGSIIGWYRLGGTEAACPVTITLEVWRNNQKETILARDYIH